MFILVSLTILAVVIVILSQLISPDTNKNVPNILGLLSIVSFIERLMLLIFLILEPRDYADIIFGLDGGFLVGNIVISMFFLLLYLDPLMESNAQLDEFTMTFKYAYGTLYYMSMIMGVHIIRLLYGGLFSINVLSNAKTLESISNYRIPLERLAVTQTFLINIPIVLQEVIAMILYEYSTNVFQIAAFGLIFNLGFIAVYGIYYLRSEWRGVV